METDRTTQKTYVKSSKMIKGRTVLMERIMNKNGDYFVFKYPNYRNYG